MAQFWDWAHELDPADRQALVHYLMHPARHRDEYIAFLRQRGDPRADIMTIDARLAAGEDVDADTRARLRALLDQVDPRWWNTVAQSSEIRACGLGPADRPVIRFAFQCPRTWQSLEPTADPNVRHCDRCAESVHLCTDTAQIAQRARQGQCISVGQELARQCRSDATASMTGRPDHNQVWGKRLLGD